MKKDVEWLKEEIEGIIRKYESLSVKTSSDHGFIMALHGCKGLINQLDEPQFTEQQISDWLDERDVVAVDRMDYKALTQDEPSKPVIPQFVGDWIESYRKKTLVKLINDAVYTSDEDSKCFRRWFHEEIGFESNYSEFLSRVWLDGYEVEEEKKYILSINITDKASKTNYETFLNKRGIFHSMENESFNSEEFNWSEEEIKDLENGEILFEHFAVKVEELEE